MFSSALKVEFLLGKTLKLLFDNFGDRPAVVCRELTKYHEHIKRGTLA